MGCRSPAPDGRLPSNYRNFSPDAFIEESRLPAHVPLPVESAIDLALKNSPQIQLLKQAAEVARAQARTCTDLRDPEVAVTYGEGNEITDRSWLSAPGLGEEQVYLTRSSNTFHGTTANSESYRVAVRFYPPNPWTMSAHASSARANYAAAVADLCNAEWLTRVEVKRLFAQIRFLKEDLALVERLVETRRVSASMAMTLSNQQQTPMVDALAASQRYIQALGERDKVERDLASARNQLLALSGNTLGYGDVSNDLVPTNSAVSAIPSPNLRERALRNRREIAAAYWRSQSAMSMLNAAKASRVPWFTRFEGSYGQTRRTANEDGVWKIEGGTDDADPSRSVSIDDEDNSEWRVEAIMSIPLFSVGPGTTRIQRAEYKRSVAALGEATRMAMAQVDEALGNLAETEARAAKLSTEIVPRLNESRTLLNDLQQRPEVLPATLEKIKEVSIETERMLLKCNADLLLARLRLEESLGLDLAEVQ